MENKRKVNVEEFLEELKIAIGDYFVGQVNKEEDKLVVYLVGGQELEIYVKER